MRNTAILVIGGGAAGFVTAAYLSAIYDLGIEYDSIYGSSSGSLNAGVFYTAGAESLKRIWLNIKNNNVYDSNPITWSGLADSRASCYSQKPLERLIHKSIDLAPIINNKDQKFYVSVTDIANERSLIINLSKVKNYHLDWILASASPPLLFPPVTISGRKYTDGGLGELINLSFAIKNGAKNLIILSPRGKTLGDKVLNNGKDALEFIATMPLNYALEKELRILELLGSEIKCKIISPKIDPKISILGFDQIQDREELFDWYYNQAKQELLTG